MEACESSNKEWIPPVLISDIVCICLHDSFANNEISTVGINNAHAMRFKIENDNNHSKSDENNFNSFPCQKFE